MTQRVTQRRLPGVRGAAVGSVLALAAGLAFVAGSAGPAAAIPAAAVAKPSEGCEGGGNARDAAKSASVTAATAAADAVRPRSTAVGTAAERISHSLPAQAPIGLWTESSVTLRTPVSKGTVRLDVTSRGFSTDSLAVQRYVPESHRWVDLTAGTSGSGSPQHAVLTFPLTTSASATKPHTVALRFMDLDRPGTFTVTASVTDGKGHTYRAPARTATTTRPEASVGGWHQGTTLTRGGPAGEFTLTVKNTTDRAYPRPYASYFAYGAGNGHALTPKDIDLQQYRPGHGWERVALVAGGCDPGMSATLRPATNGPLAPGATATYRLRVAVAGSAPRDVTAADAGVTAGNGDLSYFSQELPFTIKGGK
ncbi:hypothetical protein [Streptomyces albireticuli]|uniref:Alpha-galactosidase NEW3 domain-containing protein n=1 Tax=Streptomyces albireticuli TaxID=1940 RepID=A0A2A2D7S6_9ACTN|nr:hypothetical protein [Streptomyces albireticuli]MCD9194270.1 hypothetical protein [Streptomyces albireticuli]PAU47372.1 hypothetical protein CK936_18995 [Streptomyces albireticuli]